MWIGRGLPLNPYLRAQLLLKLIKELRPKQLQIFPEDLVFDGEREIIERTVLRNWMSQWLRWWTSYLTLCCNPEVSLESWFDMPICARSWKRSDFDPNRFKFGLLWRMYDEASRNDLSWVPRNLLGEPAVGPDSWIKGGETGKDFLLVPEGVIPQRIKEDQKL